MKCPDCKIDFTDISVEEIRSNIKLTLSTIEGPDQISFPKVRIAYMGYCSICDSKYEIDDPWLDSYYAFLLGLLE
jgi:hypothetical protein